MSTTHDTPHPNPNPNPTATKRRRKGIQDTALWRLKVRLQFTGWLQYFPNLAFVLVALALAGIGALIGRAHSLLVGVPMALAGFLALNLIFDLITVKGGWRPADLVVRPRDHLDAFDLMRSRRSCRSFQKGNLTEEHYRQVMAAVARYTEQGFLIGEAPVRFEYIATPITVWPTVGAHEFLVAIAPKTYSRDAVIDVGRSLQHVVLDATRDGIATCWIGPGADHASILKALGDRFDTERDHIICVCAVGYECRYRPLFIRMMQLGQHRRRALPDLFYADAVGEQPLDVTSPPYSEFGRTYEACQWSPSSFNSQTTRAVGRAAASDDGRVEFDFYAATASRYYAAVALGIWLADWETGCDALSIPGHFTKLTAQQRGATREHEVPHYDVSWVAEAR